MLVFSFYRCGHRCSLKKNNLPKITYILGPREDSKLGCQTPKSNASSDLHCCPCFLEDFPQTQDVLKVFLGVTCIWRSLRPNATSLCVACWGKGISKLRNILFKSLKFDIFTTCLLLLPDHCPPLYCSLFTLQTERLVVIIETAKYTNKNIRYVHGIILYR